MKCDGEGCTNTRACVFRDVGFWKGKRELLCDECWGHKFGDFTCSTCEKNCFEEDFDEATQNYLCGRCLRVRNRVQQAGSERDIDRAIESDAFTNK